MVAQLWAAVLGRQVVEGADAHDAVVLSSDLVSAGPRLAFHQVPKGKIVKNRVHLDLATNDIDGETARLTGLGATVVNTISGQARWITFADPPKATNSTSSRTNHPTACLATGGNWVGSPGDLVRSSEQE